MAFIGLTAIVVMGCQPVSSSVKNKPFTIDSVMKSDLHILVEIHQRQTLGYLRTLTEKLYRRNPRQLRKVAGATIEGRVAELFSSRLSEQRPDAAPGRLFSQPSGQPASQSDELDRTLEDTSGVKLLSQAFDEGYQDDRVLVLMAGMRNMVMAAYNNQRKFFYLDSPLDPQKFHNSARNVEIVIWRLSHERRSDGQAWLLSNALGPEVNLSYERLFGKLIGQLDMMALMVAQQRNIQIKNLMTSVASVVFLPV